MVRGGGGRDEGYSKLGYFWGVSWVFEKNVIGRSRGFLGFECVDDNYCCLVRVIVNGFNLFI